jgi:hypothetical protein
MIKRAKDLAAAALRVLRGPVVEREITGPTFYAGGRLSEADVYCEA